MHVTNANGCVNDASNSAMTRRTMACKGATFITLGGGGWRTTGFLLSPWMPPLTLYTHVKGERYGAKPQTHD